MDAGIFYQFIFHKSDLCVTSDLFFILKTCASKREYVYANLYEFYFPDEMTRSKTNPMVSPAAQGKSAHKKDDSDGVEHHKQDSSATSSRKDKKSASSSSQTLSVKQALLYLFLIFGLALVALYFVYANFPQLEPWVYYLLTSNKRSADGFSIIL